MALSDNLIEKHRITACDSGPLHFSAAMRFARAVEAEARRDALEEAAKVILETKEWKNGKWTSTICPTTADAIAAAIRKLKEDMQ